ALLGSMRSVAQIVSYEIPAGVAIVSVLLISQTLNLQEISLQQGILTAGTAKFLGFWDVSETGGLFAWNLFRAPHLIVAFLIYFIASLAECNRAPFDIPEAESELVAGFHVEYGGIRFALIFLAEYAMMLLVSMLATILFLGGWNTPLPNIGGLELATWTTGNIWGVFWLLFKSFGLVLAQMWVRWTLPRLRVAQLMTFCWKVLIQLACACLFASGIWRLLVMSGLEIFTVKTKNTIWNSMVTAWKGLKVTMGHVFQASKKRLPGGVADDNYFKQQEGLVTIQYPREKIPVPETGRYQLHVEIDDCIWCHLCTKICPVDCIEIDAIKAVEDIGITSDGTKKRLHAARFDIDMAKCMYCGLCTTVCPTECIIMTDTYDKSVTEVPAL